jgi:chromosome segregation and condensation protein ScpB
MTSLKISRRSVGRQISKLLRRLQSLGLIANTGQGQVKGEPNVWTLTQRGSEVEQALRAQTG